VETNRWVRVFDITGFNDEEKKSAIVIKTVENKRG